MIVPALKLGLAAGIGYAVGGNLGLAATEAVIKEPSPTTITGGIWAGRIATFLVLAHLLR